MTSGSLSSSANRSASSVVNRRSTSRSVRRYSSTVVILVLVHNGDRGPLRRAPFALSGQLRAEWLPTRSHSVPKWPLNRGAAEPEPSASPDGSPATGSSTPSSIPLACPINTLQGQVLRQVESPWPELSEGCSSV